MRTAIFFMILFISTLHLTAQSLTQNTSKTKVTFKIKNIGLNVDGTFSNVAISSNFNKDDVSNSFLNATIKVNSLDTGNNTRNKSLSEKDYFDTSNYPDIVLKSTKIKKESVSKYILTAQLTIKNTTKTITIPLQFSENENSITLTSYFTLNRRDYTVGKKSWVMSDTVKINVVYSADK